MERGSRSFPARLPAAGVALLAATMLAGAAAAEGAIGVVLEAARVTAAEDGTETLEPTDSIRPGEVIEYRAVYTNHSSEAVGGLQGTLPIPADTVYLDATATPAAVEASTDGAAFAAVPLVRRVVGEDGTESTEPVPASAYRVLRWQLGELAPGGSVSVSARVTVPFSPLAARP